MILHPLRAFLISCTLLLCLSCSGSKTDRPSVMPEIHLTDRYGSFRLIWTKEWKPSSILVEVTQGGETFSQSFSVPVGSSEQAIISLSKATEEMIPVRFKFGYWNGAEALLSSNTGPFPASQLDATYLDGGAQLAWTRTSVVADQVEIERLLVDAKGNQVAASPQISTLDAAVSHFHDKDGVEGQSKTYKVRYVCRGVRGAPRIFGYTFPLLFPVSELKATPTSAGPKLTWTEPSKVATSHEIYRSIGTGTVTSASRIGIVSAGTMAFLDTENLPGVFTYWVESRGPEQLANGSKRVSCLTPPQGELPLSGSLVTMPAFHQMSIQPEGFYLRGPSQILEPSGPSWVEADLPSGTYAYPLVQKDSRGRPHVVFIFEGQILHAWKESGKWHQEAIARRWIGDWTPRPFQFKLDPFDHVHITWQVSTWGDFEYATNATGSWGIVPIPNSRGPIPAASLEVDELGQAFFFFCDFSQVYRLASMLPGAPPSIEIVPTDTKGRGSTRTALLTASRGVVSVYFERPINPGYVFMELHTMERSGSTWSSPTILGNYIGNPSWASDLARSAPKDRTALLMGCSQGLMLMVRTGDGPWLKTMLGPAGHSHAMGFSPSGRLQLAFDQGRDIHVDPPQTTVLFLQE